MTEDSVAVIVERIEGVKSQLIQLDKKVDERHERAEAWREHFDSKLDGRPCVTHGKLLSSISIQLKGLWFFVALLLTIVFELLREHFSR